MELEICSGQFLSYREGFSLGTHMARWVGGEIGIDVMNQIGDDLTEHKIETPEEFCLTSTTGNPLRWDDDNVRIIAESKGVTLEECRLRLSK